MARMTEEECAKEGMSYLIYIEWQNTMDVLWKCFQKLDFDNVKNSGENTIVWNNKITGVWEIKAHMVNDKFIQVVACKQGRRLNTIELIVDDNINAIVICLFAICGNIYP